MLLSIAVDGGRFADCAQPPGYAAISDELYLIKKYSPVFLFINPEIYFVFMRGNSPVCAELTLVIEQILLSDAGIRAELLRRKIAGEVFGDDLLYPDVNRKRVEFPEAEKQNAGGNLRSDAAKRLKKSRRVRCDAR